MLFARHSQRTLARTYQAPARSRRRLSAKAFPLRSVPSCPLPRCSCLATPALPEGLEIDRSTSLNGLISNYAQHVLVCTGKDDWPSRIEEDKSGDNLAADIRELVGRGGSYSDPFHNISVLNASFPSSVPARTELQSASVYILPMFKYVPFLPRVSFDSVEALVKGYLLPEKLHPAHDGLSPVHRDRLLRQPVYQKALWGVCDIADIMVLICGHGGRDMRCGVLGPALREEFCSQLPRLGVEVLSDPPTTESASETAGAIEGPVSVCSSTARVGLISHIGGHKFAGNVIIYVPPGKQTDGGEPHPLAGHGVWYGRVEPKHVEGIVQETVLKGIVIAELFRGAITQSGDILRMPA